MNWAESSCTIDGFILSLFSSSFKYVNSSSLSLFTLISLHVESFLFEWNSTLSFKFEKKLKNFFLFCLVFNIFSQFYLTWRFFYWFFEMAVKEFTTFFATIFLRHHQPFFCFLPYSSIDSVLPSFAAFLKSIPASSSFHSSLWILP